MEWKPSGYDILWAMSVVNTFRDGGTLVFPSTLLIYAVDKKNHRLTLLNPLVLEEDENSLETHRKTKIVFKHIGYEVVSTGNVG